MDSKLENPSLSGESSEGITIDETRDIKVIQELKQNLAIAETTLLNQIEKNKLYEAAFIDKNDLIKSLKTSIELIDQNKELLIKQLKDKITDLQNALDASKDLNLSKDDANPAMSAEFEKKTTEKFELQTQQKQLDESQSAISTLAGNISQLKAEMSELKSKMRDKDEQTDEPKEKCAKIEKSTSNVESFERETDAPIDFLNRSEWPDIKFIKIGDRKMPPLLENIPSAGADWMVILRRFDGSQDFRMNSCCYEKGFGNVSGEFWLGLESIHQLTSSRRHELYIEIVNFDKQTYCARYDNFVVGGKGESYALKSIGAYSGNASYDALQDCKNGQFVYDTTLNFYWWLPQRNICCLTGKYRISVERGLTGGMYWYFQPKNHSEKGGKYIYVKACKMLIRPKL